MSNYLTIDQALTTQAGHRIPDTDYAQFLAERNDVHLFIGHIDTAEAQRRITLHEELYGGIRISRTEVLKRRWALDGGSLSQYWVRFERHASTCSWYGHDFANDPDIDESEQFDDCDCAEFEWHPNVVPESTPGAVAVTTVFAYEDQEAAA
ncbi:hypothetical protein [Streptomyces sp. NPDC088348]|uniref:hypothetical protein n=1 Tax=Streptomyces sp. NPDC088348 TaxID=3365853 RepID=UPI0037FC3547